MGRSAPRRRERAKQERHRERSKVPKGDALLEMERKEEGKKAGAKW